MTTNWEALISGEKLKEVEKERKEKFTFKRVKIDDIDYFLSHGWEKEKEYANGDWKLKKLKPIGELFENEVWNIFYKMGFPIMNDTKKFHLFYSNSKSSHKQIDVVAIDDEVCLLIECKNTDTEDNNKSWKTDLEAINGNLKGFCDEILKKYPKRKIKYIFATKNFIISSSDINRMNDFEIANFEYENIKYYKDLVNHLGSAAKYQLLGNLFSKKEIEGINEKVPAIKGKMGDLTYYSFLIEPERLLKFAYVLHRNKANHTMMPTYQRLIKKDRLTAIRNFVNDGGYFPNSLIVSIDEKKENIKFEEIESSQNSNLSKIGFLYLPKKYQSLYVIDGQHRLYGYSDTLYANSYSIPVVAFVDMKKSEQVKMFMDINENQKSVSKSLRNTLNIDLLWNSENAAQRQEALMLNIGQRLGEEKSSPLYGRIVTGEDQSDSKRCITLEYIKTALRKSNFLHDYKKNNDISKYGTFEKRDNDTTIDFLYPFIKKCFELIKNYCSDEWEKGGNGYLTINNTTYALIKIFNDIANIELNKSNKTLVNNVDSFFSQCENLLLGLADTIGKLSPEIASDIKKGKGEAAKKNAWRKLQIEFRNNCPEFTNEDLELYIQENCIDNNSQALICIESIKEKLIDELKTKILEKSNSEDWIYEYVPEEIRNNILSKHFLKNEDRKRNNQTTIEIWDVLSLKEIINIIKHGTNWSTIGQFAININNQKFSKTSALKWLKDLEDAENKIKNKTQIVTSEFNKIKESFENYCNQKYEEVLE